MLILAILLGVLLVGIGSFLISQLVGPPKHEQLDCGAEERFKRHQRVLVEKKLDHLLFLYQQKRVAEEEYLFCSDQLIDQLLSLQQSDAGVIS